MLDDAKALFQALGAFQTTTGTLCGRASRGFWKPEAVAIPPASRKAFRDAFTESCPDAVPVESGKRNGPKYEPDSGLRDTENVPLGEDVYAYFKREVLPHVPDAWIDESKRDAKDGKVGVVGYEIPFNRHFYVFEPPRPLAEIDADLKACTGRILKMLGEMSA
ncbi:hypothetical protein GL267_007420 [Acidithiobacillus ferrianus]|uniref:Uncharacterized protein n=1 Tax=Acidithiobacillus ferrianus TaxID=2678518 RepID=A0ACD5HBP1_9PROT|nr:hypothetical protein [Acidithiobacillus ferrianus]